MNNSGNSETKSRRDTMADDTFVTKEIIDDGLTDEEIKVLINLRLRAGAIKAWREGNFLFTEWKIIK